MEIFKENKNINNWGEIYLGLKKQWIFIKQIVNYCEIKKISCCNEARFIDLYLVADKNLFSFLELIKKFIIEDGDLPISHNENIINQDFSYIPFKYWKVWEVEMLLRIINSNKTKEEKLSDVVNLHSDFNYSSSWNDFIYFMSPEKNITYGIDSLYDNLLTYASNKLKEI